MLVTELGITTFCKSEYINAAAPMLVTELGIVSEVTPIPKNELGPIT